MRVVIAALAFLGFAVSAQAEKRVALVIGNDVYSNLSSDQQLQKARNDARAMSQALRDIGFQVIAAENATRRQFLTRLQEFTNTIEAGDTAAVFFAGHGVRIGGANYLLPSDVPAVTGGQEELLKDESINTARILDLLRGRGARVSLLFLDACRNNPFKDSRGRSIGGSRGLARLEPPEGTFVMYSAGAGQEALDRLSDNDSNPNSVFTRTLLPLLSQPGLEISEIAKQVRRKVRKIALTSNGHRQTPAVYNEMLQDFFLVPRTKDAVSSGGSPERQPDAGTDQTALDLALWKSVKDSNDPALFAAYLATFPDGVFAAVAKARVTKLKGNETVAVLPSSESETAPAVTPGGNKVAIGTFPTVSIPARSCQPVRQSTPSRTLRGVKSRGFLTCGVSQGLSGFSNPDETGKWHGIDVDMCRALAAAMLGDAEKVKFTPLSARERFVALQSGEVDVLSRHSTWTMTRDAALGLDFAGVNFFDGQGFMVRKSLGVNSALELSGGTVCVLTGTTTELNVANYFRKNDMQYTAVPFERFGERQQAYDNGRCDILSMDISGLAAIRRTLSRPDDHVILPEVISREPLGPLVRQGDDQWRKIVKWTLHAMQAAERAGVSQREANRQPSTTEGEALLGYGYDFGSVLGLRKTWARDVVSQVGNYGEVYARNLGPGTPHNQQRHLNELALRGGGLQYSPPFAIGPECPVAVTPRYLDLLSLVKSNNELRCGVVSGHPGMAQEASGGNWTGVGPDLCRAVAAAILRDEKRVRFVSHGLKDGFKELRDGTIEVLVGNVPYTFGSDIGFGISLAAITSYADDPLSAPLGVAVPDNNAQWRDLVTWVLFALMNAEESGLTRANANRDPARSNLDGRRLFGLGGGHFGEIIGLDNGWARRAVSAVGNYAEILDRNLGKNAGTQNASWSKGGLRFAPPVR